MVIDALAGLARLFIEKAFSTFSARDRLKVFAFWGHHVNADEVGTFLCLYVKIINPGTTAVYFERLEAVEPGGNTYFPLFYGVKSGVEVPQKRNIVGAIPCGHITSKMPTELRVYDGTERCHVLKGRKFRKTVLALANERTRLEKLGFVVHPNASHGVWQQC